MQCELRHQIEEKRFILLWFLYYLLSEFLYPFLPAILGLVLASSPLLILWLGRFFISINSGKRVCDNLPWFGLRRLPPHGDVAHIDLNCVYLETQVLFWNRPAIARHRRRHLVSLLIYYPEPSAHSTSSLTEQHWQRYVLLPTQGRFSFEFSRIQLSNWLH